MDIIRRLALTSGLLVISDPTTQLVVALAVSVSFVVAFREWKPFYEAETDTVVYMCGKAGTFNLAIYCRPRCPLSCERRW